MQNKVLDYMKEAAREFPGAVQVNSVGLQLALGVVVDGTQLTDSKMVSYAELDVAEINIILERLRTMKQGLSELIAT